MAGVAAGATRSALTYHFAQQGNAGDISAKEGSQVERFNENGANPSNFEHHMSPASAYSNIH